MATYARIPVTGVELQPLRQWRKGTKTITFGQTSEGDWVVHRSGWPWAAVFPAVLERDAAELGQRWICTRGWVEIPVEVGSDHGAGRADR